MQRKRGDNRLCLSDMYDSSERTGQFYSYSAAGQNIVQYSILHMHCLQLLTEHALKWTYFIIFIPQLFVIQFSSEAEVTRYDFVLILFNNRHNTFYKY
jgi:hypothetical protein